MRSVIGWLSALMIVGSAGCVEATAGVPTATPQQVEWTGTFENGCSPVDAAGVIFNLTAPQVDGLVQITMWAGLPLRRGSRVSLEMDDSVAVAAFCRATNDCEVASQGELHVLRSTDTFMQGELWLEFPEAGLIRGPFEARWVDSGPAICG
jgi:hypothetical protein